MASYAVLGATGNTGNSLIQLLLKTPNAKVSAYCRSKTKLIRMLPEVAENKNVEIFEGSITDVDLIKDCVKGARTIFLVVTTNDNIPGCHLSQDSVRTVINALQIIRSESHPPRSPKLLLLSSASVDEHLSRNIPRLFKPILKTAISHVYNDLYIAECMLRAEESWISTIYIKPGALSVDQQRGHALSLDEQESFISYLDLAAAMIEAAEDSEGRYDLQNVSVVNTNGSAKFPPGTPKCIAFGLLRHFFPWLHPYLPTAGPA